MNIAALAIVLTIGVAGMGGSAQLESGPVPGPEYLNPGALFSEAVVVGNLAFLSGVPSDANATIEDAVTEVLTSLNETLATLGGSLENAASSRVFLEDMTLFSRMNAVYSTFFGPYPPTRTTVQAINPAFSAIEIELIAYLPDADTASARR